MAIEGPKNDNVDEPAADIFSFDDLLPEGTLLLEDGQKAHDQDAVAQGVETATKDLAGNTVISSLPTETLQPLNTTVADQKPTSIWEDGFYLCHDKTSRVRPKYKPISTAPAKKPAPKCPGPAKGNLLEKPNTPGRRRVARLSRERPHFFETWWAMKKRDAAEMIAEQKSKKKEGDEIRRAMSKGGAEPTWWRAFALSRYSQGKMKRHQEFETLFGIKGSEQQTKSLPRVQIGRSLKRSNQKELDDGQGDKIVLDIASRSNASSQAESPKDDAGPFFLKRPCSALANEEAGPSRPAKRSRLGMSVTTIDQTQ